MEKIDIEIGGKKYLVEIAKTLEEKETGLQGRDKLEATEGMLFDFTENPGEISMLMKNTLIPLDIIFINDDNEVIQVSLGVPKDETLITAQDTAYVLEVNLNSGIKEGDELEILEDVPIMKVLALDGSSQMDLFGGERIFSRKNTVILIRKAKKAALTNSDKDLKALGRYMFKCIKGLDERPKEYVKSPE